MQKNPNNNPLEEPDSEAKKTRSDVEKTLGRRGFLKKTGRAGLGIAAILAGLSRNPTSVNAEEKRLPGDRTYADWHSGGRMSLFSNGNEVMDDPEKKRMVVAQEALYRYYLNPDYIEYLEGIGRQKEAEEAIMLAIENPYDLQYKGQDGDFEITKAENSSNNNIPDNFTIEISRWRIKYIKNNNFRENLDIFKRETEKNIDMMYDTLFNLIEDSFTQDTIKLIVDIVSGKRKSANLGKDLESNFKGAIEYVAKTRPDLAREFDILNLQIVRHIGELMEKRGDRNLQMGKKEEGLFNDLKTVIKKQSKYKSFEDLAEDYNSLFDVQIDINPDYPDLYWISGFDDEEKTMAVSYDGYIYDWNEDGVLAPLDCYNLSDRETFKKSGKRGKMTVKDTHWLIKRYNERY